MRLGQLSRIIGVQPSRISTFLEQKNHFLDAGSNSKLTDEQEQLVKAHFNYIEEEVAPATDTQDTKPPITDVITEEAAPVADTPAAEFVPEVAPPIEEITDNDAPESVKKEAEVATDLPEEITPNTEETTDEVIRAPKLKLEGLKVVGKIDLPEPKVKEEDATAEDADSEGIKGPIEEIKKKPVRKKINQRGNQNRRPERRELTIAEKRARKEREKRKREEKEREQQKQFRAAYYESKMRERKPVVSKKKKRKAAIEQDQHQEDHSPAPKTLLGKFIKWLNT